jgi:hypothetical protein
MIPSVTRAVGGFVIAAGIMLGLVRFFGEVPPGRDLECAAGAIAFGAVIAAPGVLALLAAHDRPALLLPAAWLLIPLSFISFALVTLPLLVPSFLLFRTYLRTAPDGSGWRTAATTVTVLVLLVEAGIALFANDDPREWVTATAVYGTSDVITYAEAAASLALTTTALAAGWWLAGDGWPAATRHS